ncbi:hypothetical protein SUNI508_04653 [Seiridium unicorne]|uniref:Uncharacterized protein n=1 Tax=Seiridium unicorne TaxID=138068 RepID=A0ABR2V841_9PEZI
MDKSPTPPTKILVRQYAVFEDCRHEDPDATLLDDKEREIRPGEDPRIPASQKSAEPYPCPGTGTCDECSEVFEKVKVDFETLKRNWILSEKSTINRDTLELFVRVSKSIKDRWHKDCEQETNRDNRKHTKPIHDYRGRMRLLLEFANSWKDAEQQVTHKKHNLNHLLMEAREFIVEEISGQIINAEWGFKDNEEGLKEFIIFGEGLAESLPDLFRTAIVTRDDSDWEDDLKEVFEKTVAREVPMYRRDT